MPTRKYKKPKLPNLRLPAGAGASFREELMSLIAERSDPASVYLRDELFSKYLDSAAVPPHLRRARAIEKWLACEHTNKTTNVRLLDTYEDDLGWITADRLFREVRRVILSVLGELTLDPSFFDPTPRSCGELLSSLNFTNGASTRINRSPRAALEKLTGSLHITDSAFPHWLLVTNGTLLGNTQTEGCESSVLFTVPKKSDIDRVACKEPEANMLLQRAVGLTIRRRLLKVGIDLRDQTRNQELAKSAFTDGLATVDLSAASDSITHQLVLRCLPFDWYSLLDDLRVKSTRIPEYLGNSERTHTLEMFSSMGNGFTFELETLLFYAITRVVQKFSGVKGKISVYGDDIICSSKIVPRLQRTLHYLGFKLNSKKTNYKGPFRESCGKHYYRGFDISPFYIRREVSCVNDLMLHLNHLLIWDSRVGNDSALGFLDPRLAAFHRKWSSYVPQVLWGGQDPEDPQALVTGHPPRWRLNPRTKKLPMDDLQDAAKLRWFCLTETPLSEEWLPSSHHCVVEGVVPVRETGYSLHRNRRSSFRRLHQPALGTPGWRPYWLDQELEG